MKTSETLNYTLSDIFEIFKEEYPDIKVGLSKFKKSCAQ